MENLERRTNTRFDVEPLLCRTVPETLGICVLRNVSLNGAFLLNHTPPPIGSHVRLEFSETPLRGYRVIGEVVRHHMGTFKGFALRFNLPRPRLLRAVYHTEYPN
jgi:hypothetical protein